MTDNTENNHCSSTGWPSCPKTQSILIMTVGGAHEPIQKTLEALHPHVKKVYFIVSKQTQTTLRNNILPLFPDIHHDEYLLHDPQSLTECLEDMRDFISKHLKTPILEKENIIADITGSTKIMSAAAFYSLSAAVPSITFYYVGGEQRDKGGIGTVKTGHEKHIDTLNPALLTGDLPIHHAVLVFNTGHYNAAARIIQKARDQYPQIKHPFIKNTKNMFTALYEFFKAYDEWDRFQFKKARRHLQNAADRLSDLLKALFLVNKNQLKDRMANHLNDLSALENAHAIKDESVPTDPWPILADLYTNAARTRRLGRYDDALARLYRLLEAIAQTQLFLRHNITTTHFNPQTIKDPALRQRWLKPGTKIPLKPHLGLLDAYTLLNDLNDPIGVHFWTQTIPREKKTNAPAFLSARNKSILAHGFDPVTEKNFINMEIFTKELLLLLFDQHQKPQPTLTQDWTIPWTQ